MPLGTMVGLDLGNIVLDANPSPPPMAQPPNFRSMSTVAKRSPISATAEHFSYIYFKESLTATTTHSVTQQLFFVR